MNGEDEDVFSGEVGTQPQMVNVQPPGTMMYVEKKSRGIKVIVFLCYHFGVFL